MNPCIRVVTVAVLGAVTLLSGCGETKQTAVITQKEAAAIPAAAPPAPIAATAATPALEDMTPLKMPLYAPVYQSGMIPDLQAYTAVTNVMTGSTKKATKVRIGQMYTHDSFEDVYAFYRKEMPAGSEAAEAASSTHTTDEGRAAFFEVGVSGQPGYQRVLITRAKADDYTFIYLATMPAE